MCDTCGCDDHNHSHQHDHDHDQQRSIEINESIKAKNQAYADKNRKFLETNEIFALNLLSSPGSGKTTLLENTLPELIKTHQCAVIEGDLKTDHDKQRIAKCNVPVTQINTHSSCHLDAHMVQHELFNLNIKNLDILFIENVGNLICPATYDLGEAAKVALISTTEGEDKAIKYPILFRETSLVLITKIDLLEHLDFDIEKCRTYLRDINPELQILEVSAKTGKGMEQWLDWLRKHKNIN